MHRFEQKFVARKAKMQILFPRVHHISYHFSGVMFYTNLSIMMCSFLFSISKIRVFVFIFQANH